jgi:DNA-binding NarL/FixJ family response regulator
MSDELSQRRVLIVEDGRTISRLLYALLVEANYEAEAAAGQQMLAMVPRASFDVIMMDLRCEDPPSPEPFPGIRGLCPQALGRILWIIVDLADGETMEWMEGNCTPRPQSNNLLHEVWATLQDLIGIRRLAS